MAVFERNLAQGYKLRLTVTVRSQNASAKTTTYNVSLQIIKGSGYGRWAGGPHSWSIRTPASNVVYSGSISSYDFRNYSTLTLKSGTVTASGDSARRWEGHFAESPYGDLGSGVTGGTFTPPKFPSASAPLSPSQLMVNRTSDTQHVLNWNRNSVYTSVEVWRSTGSGYVKHATISGNAATYTDTSTRAGQRYWYRVRGRNAGGYSGNSNSVGPVYTTPAAPTGVTATRVGDDIRVAVSGMPDWVTHFDIQDDGVTIATAVPRASFPWTHVGPDNLVTHRYRVRARINSGGSNSTLLYSGWSTYSAVVQLAAPPHAPSNLSPNGRTIDVMGPATFSWAYNPADSSEQSQYQWRWRHVGGSWTTSMVTVSPAHEFTILILALTFLDFGTVEWQVRTRGSHPDWSAWSATATFTLIEAPQVTVLTPVDPVQTSTITASWSVYQRQGIPQSGWEAELRSGGEVLESHSGTGAGKSRAFTTRLADGAAYEVAVRAVTSGVWSDWAVQEIGVSFIPPAPAGVVLGWSEETGAVSLEVVDERGPERAPVVNLSPPPSGSGTWVEMRRNLLARPIVPVSTGAGWQVQASVGSFTRVSDGVEYVSSSDATALAYIVRGNTNIGEGSVAVVEGTTYYARVEVENRGTAVFTVRALVMTDSGTNAATGSLTSGNRTIEPGDTATVVLEYVAEPGVTSIRIGIQRTTAGVGMPAGAKVYIPDGWVISTDPLAVSSLLHGDQSPGEVDPDMRSAWTGAPGESETILEAERPAGLGFSSGEGVTYLTADGTLKYVRYTPNLAGYPWVPPSASTPGDTYTLLGEVYAHGGPMSITPRIRGTLGDPVPVPSQEWTPIRHVGEAGTSTGTTQSGARLASGGTIGDVLEVRDIGLFAGDYSGPAFSVDTGLILVGDSWMYTGWDGTPGESLAVARMTAHTVTVTVERSVDGETWEVIAEGLAPEAFISDPESLSHGETRYRITTYAATGASTVVEESIVTDSTAVWIGGGSDYGDTARLPYDPALGVSVGRERGVWRFAGRQKPVGWASPHTTRSVNHGGTVIEDDELVASLTDFERVTLSEHPVHTYRDPTGARVYGSLSALDYDRVADGVYSYSISLEETERG